MAIKEWIYKKNAAESNSLIENLLIARGITSESDIKEFLNPLEMTLTKPEAFCDMKKAVERVVQAIENEEMIVIYGDFDADGVTSTSLLYKTLKHVGANVRYFIPDREKEGHGFDTKALIKLMSSLKPKLIISVDCGISNVEEVNFIKSFKIDVIITDHHEAPDVLPSAYAILNPKAPNSLEESLSAKQINFLTSLAGVGVAFKLAQGLLNYYNKLDFISEILPFVAVGTVADVVPLVGENRYFVLKGLELISKGKHYGLKRLLESAGYNVADGITSETIAFGVAPRINASGRLETVESAIKLLISENPQEIEMSVINLNELNRIRQKLCQDIFEQADEMVQKENQKKSPAIILYNREWQVGIIGIVASKLVEKYYKPVFMMTYSEDTKQIKCSARSIDGVHLYEVISSVGDILEGFGGHSMAAGLYFSPEKVSFEEVKSKLNGVIKEAVAGRVLKPFIEVDMELQPKDITVDFVEELSKLEPFGASNPTPIFSLSGCKLVQKKLMGDNKNHLRMIVEKNGVELTCIRWQEGDINLEVGCELDVAFQPQKNSFNGSTNVQLIIKDIHSAELKESSSEQELSLKIYDHRKKTDILPQVNDYVANSKLNIKIFAENRQIKEYLLKYSALSENIVSRKNIEKCDSLMFFDYPAEKEVFDKILETAEPSSIHLMKYDIKYLDDKELIKLLTGMIKFSCNNSGGKFDLIRCASFLGKSVAMIEKLLSLLEECGAILINQKRDNEYLIKLLSIDNVASILYNPKYEEINDLSEESELFQKSLLEDDISEISSMVLNR